MQEIFNAVIKSGAYPRRKRDGNSSEYMCVALLIAMKGGVISLEERRKADRYIQKYIKGYTTLEAAYRGPYNPNKKEKAFGCTKEGLAIYKNWAKRPKLKHPTSL